MKHTKGVGWEYAKGVVSGKILACKYVKMQCFQSLALLKKKKSDWEFVDGYVQHFVQFSKNVPHIKGTIAGTMFELADWQLFFIGQIYGWRSKKDHDIKKYTKGLLEVPRKNGKVCFL
jgi:phage terminase large subunit-like protein